MSAFFIVWDIFLKGAWSQFWSDFFLLNLMFTIAINDLLLMLSCQKLLVKKTIYHIKVMTSEINRLMLI